MGAPSPWPLHQTTELGPQPRGLVLQAPILGKEAFTILSMVEGQGLLGGERTSPAVAEKMREAWRILAKGTPFYPGHLVCIFELW